MTHCKILIASFALALAALAAPAGGAEAERVNINTADAATLARVLSGVGLKKAEAIVRYRETNGRFDAAADLAKVSGIGEATVANNRERIAIGDDRAQAPPAARGAQGARK